MMVTAAYARNFQSYERLEFNYCDLGLALVSGVTGSGKSTLMDLVPWVLYGVTSKDGAADDVRSWTGGNTSGHVLIEVVDGATIEVFRLRGSTNDLYWLESGSDQPTRGKDLADTQKRLEARLGVSAELFLIGSYMHQFSKADSFFIAKAKDRREVLEKIADQEFAVRLGSQASEARKTAKAEAQRLSSALSFTSGRLEGAKQALRGLETGSRDWQSCKAAKISKLGLLSANFSKECEDKAKTRALKHRDWLKAHDAALSMDAEAVVGMEAEVRPDSEFTDSLQSVQDRLDALGSRKCPACGELGHAAERQRLLTQIQSTKQARATSIAANRRVIDATARLERQSAAVSPFLPEAPGENPYDAQCAAVILEPDPFEPRILHTKDFILKEEAEEQELASKVAAITNKINKLTWLYDKSFELRGLLMQRAVSQIQDDTNGYLEKYFDAALRVEFTLTDSDKLEVAILNDGHNAPFRQLSGGERCMLKLSFSLSLMRAAQDRAGVSFGMVMLDEALNGLDDDLKVKAFALLQSLENDYSTVLCIDHSDALKAQFTRRFLVTKDQGHSTLVED